ncbi:MAG: glycosyltransferase WbuB [Flavobacteriaceae bacterium]|nr:MAG: glycosyltransferase WbuB [Flavobacteriaceae bacterium]
MNILLIHQYFLEKGDGGGSRFNEMSQEWSRQGHTVTVLSGMVHYSTGKKLDRYKGKYTFFDKDFYPGVHVLRSHVSESYNVNFIGRLWGYFSFVFSSLFTGIFKTNKKFDIILVTSPPLFVGITAYILSKVKSIPFVFEIRDLWPESAIDNGVLQNKFLIKFAYWFEAFMYKKAVLINTLTPAFRDKLITEKKVPSEKIIMIPNASDFSLAEKLSSNFNAMEFKKELGFSDKFVITYVGAHGLANDLFQLILVAEELKNTNVIFQLIGDGMQKEFLVSEAKKRNLKNVIFRNSVSKQEVFKYILSSDVGVSILKKVDTFKTIYSNKTFDYMSCKIPILLAIDGVSRDLIEKANCGLYAEPENISEISMAVKKLMNLPKEELKSMGENGYNYAKIHFDRVVLAEKYMQELMQKTNYVS